jgi:hypothetical protein
MCITSHLEHEVTEISCDIPRILWVYGFGISTLEMNHIFNIKFFAYS